MERRQTLQLKNEELKEILELKGYVNLLVGQISKEDLTIRSDFEERLYQKVTRLKKLLQSIKRRNSDFYS